MEADEEFARARELLAVERGLLLVLLALVGRLTVY